MKRAAFQLRGTVASLAAASVGLSMAIISTSKLLLFIAGLITLMRHGLITHNSGPLKGFATPVAILIVLAAFGLSLLWSQAPMEDALGAISKYGKLLSIVLMMVLIRTRSEAKIALMCFVAAQVFLLASSWALFAGWPIPWATSNMALNEYAVFSSYLDQGILSAVFASICWHMRSFMPGRYGQAMAIGIGAAALCNVLFVLSGRTGHVVAIALLSLAIMWQLPKKFRVLIVILPFVVGALTFFSSSKVRERLTLVSSEMQAYSNGASTISSSGTRLELWTTSMQSIARHPVIGTGAGSWSTQYNLLRREKNLPPNTAGGHYNPHQEYLLWGVQLGLPGIALLLGLLVAICRDALGFEQPVARAVMSTVAALAVACCFNSSLYDALIGDFFCVALGLLLAFGARGPAKASASLNNEKATA